MKRRNFLKMLSASIAALGVGSTAVGSTPEKKPVVHVVKDSDAAHDFICEHILPAKNDPKLVIHPPEQNDVNWLPMTHESANDWLSLSVAYGDGHWIAVSSDSKKVFKSPDMVTWTPVEST